jgi:formiminotetrahydrofolate cyclodeaminase
MSSSKRLIDFSLEAYSAALASKNSTPAGGSSAASAGAQGVALGAKVIWLSAARAEGEAKGYLEGTAEELEDLGDCLLELVDRDAQAYRAFCLAQESGASPESLAERAQAALDAPAEIAELGLIALRRLHLSREHVAAHLEADLAVSIHLLCAAIKSGLVVARVNLPGLGEPARVEQSSAILEELARGYQDLSAQLDAE